MSLGESALCQELNENVLHTRSVVHFGSAVTESLLLEDGVFKHQSKFQPCSCDINELSTVGVGRFFCVLILYHRAGPASAVSLSDIVKAAFREALYETEANEQVRRCER